MVYTFNIRLQIIRIIKSNYKARIISFFGSLNLCLNPKIVKSKIEFRTIFISSLSSVSGVLTMETVKISLQDKDEWQDPTNVNFKLLGEGKFILMQRNSQKTSYNRKTT